jgi:hypothetical protein
MTSMISVSLSDPLEKPTRHPILEQAPHSTISTHFDNDFVRCPSGIIAVLAGSLWYILLIDLGPSPV